MKIEDKFDFWGNKLEIGDTVVFSWSSNGYFKKTKVTGFKPKWVLVERPLRTKEGKKVDWMIDPNKLIKQPDNIENKKVVQNDNE